MKTIAGSIAAGDIVAFKTGNVEVEAGIVKVEYAGNVVRLWSTNAPEGPPDYKLDHTAPVERNPGAYYAAWGRLA